MSATCTWPYTDMVFPKQNVAILATDLWPSVANVFALPRHPVGCDSLAGHRISSDDRAKGERSGKIEAIAEVRSSMPF